MYIIALINKGIKTAVIQMNIVQGDIPYNLSNAVQKIKDAAANGAELVCLPEAFATGMNFMQLHNIAQPIGNSEIVSTLCELANSNHIYIIGGFIEKEESGHIFDTAIVIDDEGKIAGKYRRRLLWSGETTFLTGSNDYCTYIDTKIGRIGIIIGYELFFPQLCKEYFDSKVDVIVCIANIFTSLRDKANALVRARAVENQCYFLFSSSIGTHTLVSDTYMGCSTIACDKTLLPKRLINTKAEDPICLVKTENREDIIYNKLYISALRDSKERYFKKDYDVYKKNMLN